MQDATFGEVEYEDGWIGRYSYAIYGHPVETRLVVPCDEGDAIEQAQRDAFTRFDADRDRLVRAAEQAIYAHYKEVVGEVRERLGPDFADRLAPVVDDPRQMDGLVRATETLVQQTFGSDDRVVGLLFSCTWEPSLGLAVKFVNESVDEVGTQDIVL